MKKRDHYATLGVDPNESPLGIRSAYLKLVKTYHPDLAGPASTRRLQEINEAYSVLSDPEARESYNRELKRLSTEEKASPGPIPVKSASRPTFFGSRHEFEPWRDSTFSRFLESFFRDSFVMNFTGIPASRVWSVEVILSPEEALKGGVLPIPIPGTCPACMGSSARGGYPCTRCSSRGWLETGESVPVRIPPGISHGSVLDFPLTEESIQWKRIRLHITVRGSCRG